VLVEQDAAGLERVVFAHLVGQGAGLELGRDGGDGAALFGRGGRSARGALGVEELFPLAAEDLRVLAAGDGIGFVAQAARAEIALPDRFDLGVVDVEVIESAHGGSPARGSGRRERVRGAHGARNAPPSRC
jgi:hypothetical protein